MVPYLQAFHYYWLTNFPDFSSIFLQFSLLSFIVNIAIIYVLRRPDPISCRKWDVSYLTTLKKKITNFYVACAAIYSNNTLTNECWK